MTALLVCNRLRPFDDNRLKGGGSGGLGLGSIPIVITYFSDIEDLAMDCNRTSRSGIE